MHSRLVFKNENQSAILYETKLYTDYLQQACKNVKHRVLIPKFKKVKKFGETAF